MGPVPDDERGTAVRTRWMWTVVAVLGLAAASVVALPATPAQSAVGDFGTDSGSGSAVVANAGTGRYKDRISWVSWGAPGTALAAKTVRTWQQVGPTTRLEVTCSLSAITGSVLAYRPGNWAPDGLTRLYRTTDTPNNLAVGLGLGNDGGTAGFTVAVPDRPAGDVRRLELHRYAHDDGRHAQWPGGRRRRGDEQQR